MRDSKLIGIAAGLVTLGAWGFVYLSADGVLGPRINPKLPEATGWVIGRQTLGLLKPGGQVTVITRDTADFKNPASDIQLASFNRTLREAHISVAKSRALQLDPLRPVEVPPGDFYDLIRSTPKGSVIVSFMGPPLLTEQQCKQLGENKPSIVAFCSGSLPERFDLRAIFEQGLLQAAVVSRKHPTRSASPPRDAQAWFDEAYQVVTAATVGNLSAQGGLTGGAN